MGETLPRKGYRAHVVVLYFQTEQHILLSRQRLSGLLVNLPMLATSYPFQELETCSDLAEAELLTADL